MPLPSDALEKVMLFCDAQDAIFALLEQREENSDRVSRAYISGGRTVIDQLRKYIMSDKQAANAAK
jgi:hypothetical protein